MAVLLTGFTLNVLQDVVWHQVLNASISKSGQDTLRSGLIGGCPVPIREVVGLWGMIQGA
jgi:hypothetical protein